jgi:hypothetical protein
MKSLPFAKQPLNRAFSIREKQSGLGQLRQESSIRAENAAANSAISSAEPTMDRAPVSASASARPAESKDNNWSALLKNKRNEKLNDALQRFSRKQPGPAQPQNMRNIEDNASAGGPDTFSMDNPFFAQRERPTFRKESSISANKPLNLSRPSGARRPNLTPIQTDDNDNNINGRPIQEQVSQASRPVGRSRQPVPAAPTPRTLNANYQKYVS